MGQTWNHQQALTFEEEDSLRIFIDPTMTKAFARLHALVV